MGARCWWRRLRWDNPNVRKFATGLPTRGVSAGLCSDAQLQSLAPVSAGGAVHAGGPRANLTRPLPSSLPAPPSTLSQRGIRERPRSAQSVYCIPVPSLYILPPQSPPCHPGGDWWRGRLATRRPSPATTPTLSRHPAASPVLALSASPPPLPAHPPAGALLCLRVTAASRHARLVGCGAGDGLGVFPFPASPFPPPSVHVTCVRVGRWVRFPRHCRH